MCPPSSTTSNKTESVGPAKSRSRGFRLALGLAVPGRLLVGLALVAALFSLGLPDVTSVLLASGGQVPATVSQTTPPQGGDSVSGSDSSAVLDEVAPEPSPPSSEDIVYFQLLAEQGSSPSARLASLVPDSREPTVSPASSPVPTQALTASPKAFTYTVQAGESLLGLARKFGITPETVLWANDLGNGELIQIGQQLTILPVSGVLHEVKKGDSVTSIADAYVADAQEIMAANGLVQSSASLAEGQKLIVPGGIMRTTEPIPALPAAPSAEELAASAKYTVKVGDSLGSIADNLGVLPSGIQVANGITDPDMIQVGQELAVPSVKPAAAQRIQVTAESLKATATLVPSPVPTKAPAPSQAAASKYTIEAGDNLYSIAVTLKLKVTDLQAANGLTDASVLQVGQQLSVPGGTVSAPTSTKVAQATPTPQPPTPTVVPPAAKTATPTPPAKAAQPPAPTPQPVPAGSTRGAQIAALAQKYIGYRYIWGGHSTNGFDCSGFTWYVYREAGLTIPMHDLGGQLGTGPRVPRDQLQPGDLVFFQNTYMAGLSHVGIYLGGGRFINAETEKVGVQVRSMSDPYWSSRFVGASRPW